MASIAQLAEHALRKRTVVGSIPTGGFIISLHHHAQHHHLKNQDLFLSRSFDIVPSLNSFFSSSAREAERERERERQRERERVNLLNSELMHSSPTGLIAQLVRAYG